MAFGFLKKIGKGIVGGLKGAAKVVGGVTKKAAPLVGLIPGVGPVIGAGLGVSGSLMSDIGSGRRISLSEALKTGAKGGLSGFGGAKLLGGKGLPGLLRGGGGVVGKLGGAKGVAGSVLGTLKGGGGGAGLSALDIAQLGLGGLGAIEASRAAGRQRGLQDEALGLAREEYAGRDPLRRAAIQGLTAGPGERVDLSSTFGGSSNPFAREVREPPAEDAPPVGLPTAGPPQRPVDHALGVLPGQLGRVTRRALETARRRPSVGRLGRGGGGRSLVGSTRDMELF